MNQSHAEQNSSLSVSVVKKLLEWGVREFCVCAGARNAPLVAQLESTSGIKVFSFFDERSAAFFAMGRIRSLAAPVAVVMTSGTAVAETLPAVIEAHYQGLPLVIVSADRPARFRKSGAPQAIEQVGIFSSYVSACLDLSFDSQKIETKNWKTNLPLHLNLCFEEPNSDLPTSEIDANHFIDSDFAFLNQAPLAFEAQPILNPVIIVGPLQSWERHFVQSFLEATSALFIAEVSAGLKLSAKAKERQILCPEKTLDRAMQKNIFQAVVKIGATPTLRFWRDLEEKYSQIQVFSFSSGAYSGLARKSHHSIGLHSLQDLKIQMDDITEEIIRFDREKFLHLESLLQKYPLSEPAFVRRFANLSCNGSVYLGNSLPIRHWDLVAPHYSIFDVWANRGANGIDGQISSYLGWTQRLESESWSLFGDLTALYDLSAPWVTPFLSPSQRKIVIINNSGGQIFRHLLKKEIFLNSHQIHFKPWAEMWGWDYQRCVNPEQITSGQSQNQIIELIPDQSHSDQLRLEWKKF